MQWVALRRVQSCSLGAVQLMALLPRCWDGKARQEEQLLNTRLHNPCAPSPCYIHIYRGVAEVLPVLRRTCVATWV